MIKCQILRGIPGSGDSGAQPFSISVAPAAELLMDFHAHLYTDEIIGYLVSDEDHSHPGGHYDHEKRHIVICQAFPGKQIATTDDSVNVEMDPESQVTWMTEM
eukprot:scaffold888_cov569-Prasinococcus_capsulatus_cf.AAC.7